MRWWRYSSHLEARCKILPAAVPRLKNPKFWYLQQHALHLHEPKLVLTTTGATITWMSCRGLKMKSRSQHHKLLLACRKLLLGESYLKKQINVITWARFSQFACTQAVLDLPRAHNALTKLVCPWKWWADWHNHHIWKHAAKYFSSLFPPETLKNDILCQVSPVILHEPKCFQTSNEGSLPWHLAYTCQ